MIHEILTKWKKSRIELDSLQQQCHGISCEDFAVLIRDCMNKGILLPIKSAGSNGSGLPYKFTIAKGRLLSDNVAQINKTVQAGAFSSLLSFSWYYEQPLKVWEAELPYIRLLDAYLKAHQQMAPASIQQRSFEIFHDEKWLLEHDDFPGHIGLNLKQLSIVTQPDPLMLAINPFRWSRYLSETRLGNASVNKQERNSEYQEAARLGNHQECKQENKPLERICYHLAVENKAAYYGLLPYLPESPFVSLILGYGWKIVGNLPQLANQLGQLPVRHRVLYFGDFDAEGISIWHSLMDIDSRLLDDQADGCQWGSGDAGVADSGACSSIQVELATEFYRAMLDLSPVMGKVNQQLNQLALAAFGRCFSKDERECWQRILQEGRYYPQEILSSEKLDRILCRYKDILL